MSPRLILLAAVAALVPLTGCPVDPEGIEVGTFAVTGTVRENTCGEAAFGTQSPLRFNVELRDEPDSVVAYWRRPQAAIVNGTQIDGAYRFDTTVPVTLIPQDLETGVVGCAVSQAEEVAVQLAEGVVMDAGAPEDDAGPTDPDAGVANAPPGGFTGTNRITLTPITGSDCAAALATGGGTFLELPCTVQYDLVGTPRDSVF